MFIRKLMLLVAVSLSLPQTAVAGEDTPIIERIDAEVRANAQWTQEAEQCPADLMPGHRALEIDADGCDTADQLDGCLARCTAGDAYACLRTAVTLQRLGGDPAGFEPLYQRACKLGAASGCTNHAAGLYRADMQNERVQACRPQLHQSLRPGRPLGLHHARHVPGSRHRREEGPAKGPGGAEEILQARRGRPRLQQRPAARREHQEDAG